MKGRKKLLSLAALLSVSLIIPLALSWGAVDVSKFSLGSLLASSTVEHASDSTPLVFVDPVNILDETKQSGSLVIFHVNVSDVTDLFAWQVNVTWDSAILNITGIVPSEFLARSVNLTSSEILGFVINCTGSVVAAEAIMANTTGISGSGRLVTIEFEVLDYGSTDLNISVSGALPPMLLNSTGDSMTHETTDGYFSNKILGDVNGDGIVDGFDFSLMGGAYRATPGDPNWNEDADINRDGIVDGFDFSIAGGNYRRSI